MTRSSGRVLVTGATGFLGSHVVEALAARGIAVRALSRRAGGGPRAGPVELATAGLDDPEGLRRALVGVTSVVHLAAHVHETGARPDESAHRSVNLDGTAALLEAAVQAGVSAFVFVSTVKAVAETSRAALTERTPAAPADAYGRTKLAAEAIVRETADRYGLHAPILRLPLVYGPGMKANALRLFELVESGAPLPLGAVDNRRSLLYVGNFVAALEAVCREEAGNDLFFVCDGAPVATPDLIRAIARALDRPARLVPVPVALLRAAGRVGDLVDRLVPWPLTSAKLNRLIGSLEVDGSKLRAIAGEPPFTLEQGLRETARWFRAREVR